MVGSREYCGEYCQSDTHLFWAERWQECNNSGHMGPWHAPNGDARDTCSSNPKCDALDHEDCPVCLWEGGGGLSVLDAHQTRRTSRAPGWNRPIVDETVEHRLATFEVRARESMQSTDRTDRDRVRAALREYFGDDALPIEFVASPLALSDAIEEAHSPLWERMEVARPKRHNEPPLREWPLEERAGWSISVRRDRWGQRRERALRDLGRSDVTAAILGIETMSQSVASLLSRRLTGVPQDTDRDRLVTDAGQFDTWTWQLAASVDVLGVRVKGPRVQHLALMRELAESAGPALVLKDRILVSERPLVMSFDGSGRLHSEHGPAIAYGDGLAVHAWHGIQVEPWIINAPERITVEAIDETRNAELRRVLIERFGAERLVREGNAELVDEDETGRLWRRPTSTERWTREEPIVMVEVVNSTPEPDGSRKTYWLRVPPGTERQPARAWLGRSR